MERIEVFKLIGAFGVTREDGDAVRAAVEKALEGNRQLVVDFAGVSVLASPFLNAAFGRLTETHPIDRLNGLVRFENLPAGAAPVLQRVLANARTYYHDAGERARLDEILETHAAEA